MFIRKSQILKLERVNSQSKEEIKKDKKNGPKIRKVHDLESAKGSPVIFRGGRGQKGIDSPRVQVHRADGRRSEMVFALQRCSEGAYCCTRAGRPASGNNDPTVLGSVINHFLTFAGRREVLIQRGVETSSFN